VRRRRTLADDEADRQRVLDYEHTRAGQSCQEAEIKKGTGVAKESVRNLMRDVPGIDLVKLRAGLVCWNPPE
jgi:hypothetical protein